MMSRHSCHAPSTLPPNRFSLFPTMKHPDTYASRESSRNRAYRAAFASPEARAWAAALTPAERARAQALGLLTPYIDPTPGDNSIETLPCALEPRVENRHFANERPILYRQPTDSYDELNSHHQRLLQAFLQQDDNPALLWACLRFIMGRGTCTEHAKSLGLSKQTFHYHAQRLASLLGLPALGYRASDRAREAYRLLNSRRGYDSGESEK